MSEENKIWYALGADTSDLNKDIERAKQAFKGLSDSSEKEGQKMENMLGKVAAAVGVAFTVQQAYQFAKAIADVRGEFQQLEVAFTTMLGSKAQSDQLMSQLVKTAATTPFQLTDVAGGAKQLLAYGTAADKVNDTLVRLGNVASGMNIPLSDMVYLYGTTQVQGRLYAQDMRQFMGRGIPLVEELAKQFGVSKDKISDMVTAGKVGFPEVEKAFISMTSQGGKFYNLMEAQSKTITGQISNLKDAVDMAMNDIGKSSEGAIEASIAGAKFVVENYETIGKILAGLVVTYGAYKTAVIVAAAAEEIGTGIKLANALAGTTMTASQAIATAGTNLWAMAQAKLNATIMANPYVLAATALVGFVALIWALNDSTTAAEKAESLYNEETKRTTEAMEKQRQQAERNIQTATDMALTDQQRAGAINELRKLYPDILAKYNMENLSLREKLQLIKDINEAQGKAAEKSHRDQVADSDKQIAELKKQIARYEKAKDDAMSRGKDGSIYDAYIQNTKKAIEVMQAKKRMHEQDVEADNVNKWTANIGNMSDAQIENAIRVRKQTIQALNGKKETEVAGIDGLGYFRADELKTQNAALEAELTNRRKAVTKDKAFWEDQKKKAQESQDIMGQEKIGSKEWKVQQKLIDEADAMLKARNKTSQRNAAKERAKSAEEVAKDKLAAARKNKDLEYQIEQQNIDLMDEGVNKEIRQNKLNHERKLTEYERMREDELQRLQDIEQEKWKAAGNKGTTPVTATLSAASVSNYAQLVKNENDLWAAADKKAKDEALARYNDFEAKKLKINQDFEKAKTDIIAANSDESVQNTKIAEAQKIRDKELKDLTDTLMKEVGLLDLMEGNGAEFIKAKIKQQMPLFEDVSKLTHSQLLELKKIIADIEFTPEQLAAIAAGNKDLAELQKLLDKFKEKSTDAVNEEDFKNILALINKISASAEKLGGILEKAGGAVGEIGAGLSAAAGAADDVAAMFNKDATTADKVSAAVSGIIDIMSMIADQIEENKKAQEEWNAKITESAHKARIARIEMDAYSQSNLFNVENPYAKAIAGANQYADAMKILNEASSELGDGQVQTGTKKVVSGKNIGKGIGAGAAAGAAIGSIIPGLGTAVGAAVGAGVGLVIGGIAGALSTKTVPVFNSLKDQYGEIFNSETFELNPKILQDYGKLDDATKKMVDNWEEVRTKAKEAQDQMRQTFSDLAGSIGSDLSTALVDAFTNGDVNGAIDTFKGKITETIEAIIQKMIFSQYFQSMFDDLEKKMNDSFGASGDQNIVDDIMWFTSQYPKALGDYNTAMQGAQDELKKQGLDIFSMASGRSASSKGISSANQDSIDELNGRFTAVQAHTFNINETLKIVAANGILMLQHLSNIDTNTARLATIEQTIGSVKAGIDSINTKGIFIKT